MKEGDCSDELQCYSGTKTGSEDAGTVTPRDRRHRRTTQAKTDAAAAATTEGTGWRHCAGYAADPPGVARPTDTGMFEVLRRTEMYCDEMAADTMENGLLTILLESLL